MIGDDVVLTVLQVKGNTVRIGIEAPDEIHVMRGELKERKRPAPKPERKSIPVPYQRATDPQSTVRESSTNRIIELKFDGNSDEPVNRLTEIAKSLPTLGAHI